MKKFFLFSLCVILATVSALAQETTPCPTNDPLIAEMRDVSIPIGERFRKWEEWARKHYPSQYLKKDYSYYFEELDKLINAGGLTYSDIRKSIFTIGFYCNAKQQHERHEKYTRFALSLDNPQITLRARHAGTMYNFLMNRSEFAETEAMILKAIGNCTWEVTLHPMLAHFYTLTDQPEKCWKVFGDCAAVNTNFQAVAEIAMARAREQYRLLDEDGARKTLTEAIARLDAAKSPFATTCRLRLASYHPPPEARPIYESILANTAGLVESTERRAPKTLASTQAEALRHFISDSWEQGGVTHFLGNWSDNKAVFDKYFDNVISNRQTGVLQRPLIAARNDAIIYGAYEKALELSARIERINAKEAGSFLFGLYKINALYGCGRHEEAAEFARQRLAEFPDYTQPQKFWLALVSELDSPDFGKAVKEVMRQFPLSDDFTPQQRSSFILKAGRTAMMANRHDAAKIIEQTYNELYQQRPNLTLGVEFLDKPLAGITDFRARGLVRKMQPMERKLRVDKAFLEADVNITGRGENIGTVSDENFKPASLLVVADELGLNVMYRVPTDDLEAARAKRQDLGSLEIYIAAGSYQPYGCVIGAVTDAYIDPANLVYSTAQHKRYPKRLSELKRDDILFEDGAVWKRMFLSWQLFSDKLPEDGDIWDFDTIHWAPAGAFSWSSGGHAHARASWGELHFKFSKSDILKIKRTVIYNALAHYRRERRTTRSYDGIIGHWSDEALGDPKFYAEVVTPLIEKLDGYTRQVSSGMTEADVERIYAEAVPGWNNIVYIINDLRLKYLKDIYCGN